MVVTDPKLSQRRIWWERLIWFVDMVSYIALGVAGVTTAVQASSYVRETVQIPWVILLWAILIGVGGVVGFIGRLSRIWAIEIGANVLAAWGAFLYALILLPAVAAGSSVAALAIVLVGWGAMVRRYAELRIFTSDPRSATPFTARRLEEVLRRRTKNTVPRQHY